MRKPPYVPTSKQGVPEVDAAQFFAIDGVGMESAGELLDRMKIAKLADKTWPNRLLKNITPEAWLRLCAEMYFEIKERNELTTSA